MCTGKCSKFIGISLYPLALLSITCNIFLFFPDFQTIYSKEAAEGLYRLTDEIKLMGGVVGGGILVSNFSSFSLYFEFFFDSSVVRPVYWHYLLEYPKKRAFIVGYRIHLLLT